MKNSGFFTVGGFIGRGVPVFELERNWEKLLKRYKLDYFKASECESGKGQFAKYVADPKNITADERKQLNSISHDFCRLIGNPVNYDNRSFLALLGTAILQKDFYDLIKKPKARAILGTRPYRLAYDFAMIQCAWAMKQLEKDGADHCVSFVCDEEEQNRGLAPAAYLELKEKNPEAAKYMGAFSMHDEKHCAPLQAADAVVYEVRKVLKYQFKDWETILREQFQIFSERRVMFYIGHSSRKQLAWIVANHQAGEPFRLDELMNREFKRNVDRIGVRKTRPSRS